MKRKIITTGDGSKTIQLVGWDEQYHSKHGAIQEAYHVFIKNGLQLFSNQSISILEIGFGTGLNALITLIEAQKLKLSIDYVGVEAYPVCEDELILLDYTNDLNASKFDENFKMMHESTWEECISITPKFKLTKQKKDFMAIDDIELYDLVYFDAFGARVQPELWGERIFLSMYRVLKPDGVLVTYAAKGSVRRAMLTSGFQVERLPGPPGKREMLRSRKIL